MADLNYVLERQPHNAKAHYLKAKVLELAARYDEAVTELGEALTAETDEPAYPHAVGAKSSQAANSTRLRPLSLAR